MTDAIFEACVDVLKWLASLTGTTYKEVNVIIFCVLWPLATIGLAVLCLAQRIQIRRLRRLTAPTCDDINKNNGP